MPNNILIKIKNNSYDTFLFLSAARPIIVTAAFVFRMATNPMIRHFGDRPGDTHGSARFATPQEIARLVQSPDGLLIGRDIKSGKPLRYDGPAHLLTMAPTRTGRAAVVLWFVARALPPARLSSHRFP